MANKAKDDGGFVTQCMEYYEMTKGTTIGNCLSETQSRVHLRKPFTEPLVWFATLDGNFFNPTALADNNGTPLLDDDNGDKRAMLLAALAEINREVGTSASPHFAILLMDGDSLGGALASSKTEDHKHLSNALRVFSERVPPIVQEHSGRCVYAGGDDVLAMLPVTTTKDCAVAIRQAYLKAFNEYGLTGTISAAIIFAHYKLPFSTLLKESHYLLNNVAKDATGRDSIAFALHKGSGLAVQWSVPWKYFLGEDVGSGEQNPDWFTTLQNHLCDARNADGDKGNSSTQKISSSFLYNLRQRINTLSDKPIDNPGAYITWPFENFNRLQFFIAEWMVGKKPKKSDGERQKLWRQGEALLQPLVFATQKATRSPTGEIKIDEQTFNLDAALLARFIAEGGKENV